MRGCFEVSIDGRLVFYIRADSITDAREIACREFPRRAVRVRPVTDDELRRLS